jgi:hypothetical protein
MNPRPATTDGEGRKSSPTDVVLHGRRLFFARLAWFALAALTVGLFVASVPVAYEQLSTYNVALSIVSVLGFWAIGAILFWKSSSHRVALYASVMLVTFGTVQVGTLHWLAEAYPVWAPLPVALVNFVGEASFFVLFCVFPDGRFVPRWTRWAAIAWITYWLVDSFFPDSSPISPRSWPLVIDASLFLGLIGTLVVAQIYRYRRVSGPVERQQTKWVVFGLTATIAAFVVVLLIGGIFLLTQPGNPQFLIEDLSITLYLFALLIPLSIGVAILRYRLWDIDLIIRRSLVIGPLLTILTVVFELANLLLLPFIFKFIPPLEDSEPINTVVSVVIVVVLFKPLHARLDTGVNRLVDWLVIGRQHSRRLARRRG